MEHQIQLECKIHPTLQNTNDILKVMLVPFISAYNSLYFFEKNIFDVGSVHCLRVKITCLILQLLCIGRHRHNISCANVLTKCL